MFNKWFKWEKSKGSLISAYAFAIPYLLLFFIFTVIPVAISIFLSFTEFNVLQTPTFIGIENYLTLVLEDEIFLIALKNTIVLAMITGPVGYILCFFFAWCLNELSPKLRAILTFCLFAPSISGNAYLIFTLFFNDDSYGFLNGFLLNQGWISEPVRWFKDPEYMMGLVILVLLWMSLGTSLLVFIAGFQGVDRSLYEAAAMDGGTKWEVFWFITFPMLTPILMVTLIYTVVEMFTNYSNPVMQKILEYGNKLNFAYSSTIAWLYFLIIAVLLALVFLLFGRRVVYAD